MTRSILIVLVLSIHCADAQNYPAKPVLKHQAKIDLTHVPYKGVAPAMVDLVGGQIELVMAGITNAAPLVKSGRVKALGITSRKRSAVLPEVRPIVEQGLPDYETSTWYGIFVPAATPQRILSRLNAEIVQITASAEVRERFANQGGEARTTTREAFAVLIERDLRTWQTVVNAAGLRAE
jgi:tripartite-type tricarboxylate transporter receptor subunit TctC